MIGLKEEKSTTSMMKVKKRLKFFSFSLWYVVNIRYCSFEELKVTLPGPGSLFRVPDPNFSIPDPMSKRFWVPGSDFLLSRIRLFPVPDPDPGSWGQKST